MQGADLYALGQLLGRRTPRMTQLWLAPKNGREWNAWDTVNKPPTLRQANGFGQTLVLVACVKRYEYPAIRQGGCIAGSVVAVLGIQNDNKAGIKTFSLFRLENARFPHLLSYPYKGVVVSDPHVVVSANCQPAEHIPVLNCVVTALRLHYEPVIHCAAHVRNLRDDSAFIGRLPLLSAPANMAGAVGKLDGVFGGVIPQPAKPIGFLAPAGRP